MENNHYELVMSTHSDDTLTEILSKRNNYQSEAAEAAINEALKRGLISDEIELEQKYPISISNVSVQTEISFWGKKIDFNKYLNLFYFIGIFSLLFSLSKARVGLPILPILFLGLVYSCSKTYNMLYANIVIWYSAVFLALLSISIVFVLYFYFFLS